MSFNFSDDDFEQVASRFVRAAARMAEDGWWWRSSELTDRVIQKQLAWEMVQARFPLLARRKRKPGPHSEGILEEAR